MSSKVNQETRVDLGERLSEKELCPDELLAEQEAAFARDVSRLQARSQEFVEVSCPACSRVESEMVFEKFHFRFNKCESCETIFMSPRPSKAVMADYYGNSENYAYWAKYIFPASEFSRREKIHKPWFKKVLHYCKRYHIKQGTLVEVGPGFGTFSAVATESGKFDHVIAIEPTPELAHACRQRGVNVVQRRIEDIQGEVSQADVLVAFEVIEHLFEPRIFLQQCVKLLRSDGMVILSCPNGQGFDISMLGPKALAVDAEHVNLFNPVSLSELLERSGFEVLEVSTPGRLDGEFVREAARKGEIDLSKIPFLQKVLIDEWSRLGWPFQQFLAENNLSSHMWIAARKRKGA